MKITRVEVTPKQGDGLKDVRGDLIKRQLKADHSIEIAEIRSIVGFLVSSDIPSQDIAERCDDLFADPIIEHSLTDALFLESRDIFPNIPDAVISVGFKPGVTDNPGKAALDGFTTLFPNTAANSDISTYITYVFYGVPQEVSIEWLSATLYNNLIERAVISNQQQCQNNQWPAIEYPVKPPQEFNTPKHIDLEISDDDLIEISEQGLLALNLEEMQAIQSHYRNDEIRKSRNSVGIVADKPTDVELECLAQTWSEHCKHKIFASKIHHQDLETGEQSTIDSIFKTHIMKPTHDMQNEVDWLLSVFHDNSGVIAWDDEWSVCMKAETHNSPSALDPYGGAMTGIVGVNRDILGTGLGARPIANTDVFCFGPPNWQGHTS